MQMTQSMSPDMMKNPMNMMMMMMHMMGGMQGAAKENAGGIPLQFKDHKFGGDCGGQWATSAGSSTDGLAGLAAATGGGMRGGAGGSGAAVRDGDADRAAVEEAGEEAPEEEGEEEEEDCPPTPNPKKGKPSACEEQAGSPFSQMVMDMAMGNKHPISIGGFAGAAGGGERERQCRGQGEGQGQGKGQGKGRCKGQDGGVGWVGGLQGGGEAQDVVGADGGQVPDWGEVAQTAAGMLEVPQE